MTHPMKLTLACGLLAATCWAQNEGTKSPEPTRYFHLDYAVLELEGGKVVNTRHYLTTTDNAEACSIRTGSRVPVATSNSTFTYFDVGVNIDCSHAHEVNGNLAIKVAADISSLAAAQNTQQPVIRQNKWSANVIVPLNKPTVIFSSDDVASKGQMQFELTATPIK